MKPKHTVLIAAIWFFLSQRIAAASYTNTVMNDGFAQVCGIVAEAIAAAAVVLWRWCTRPL